MTAPPNDSFDPGLAGLERANARLDDVIEAFGNGGRHIAGLPTGGLGLAVARAATPDAPIVVLTRDTERAHRLAEAARTFSSDAASVVVLPGYETSAYTEVAPDRRATMDRMAALHRLSTDAGVRVVVVPVDAAMRLLPPREAIEANSVVIEAETELDRDRFVRTLDTCGYLRVPVAEDPGTYAVRGFLLDVYPADAPNPFRIELDDWLVLSIKEFDPDDQRTLGERRRVAVHPVSPALLNDATTALARERVRALCDEASYPTSKTKKLLEDLEDGRHFYGIEGFLPAFYRGLDGLGAYLNENVRVVVDEPSAVNDALYDAFDRVVNDRGARVADGKPSYPVDALYLDPATFAAEWLDRRTTLVHRVAVLGKADEDDGPLGPWLSIDQEALLHLGGEDQRTLVGELDARRKTRGRDDALRPLARRVQKWLDQGTRVLFTARTETQADRLVSLLGGYDVPIERASSATDDRWPEGGSRVRAEVTLSPMGAGFVLPTEAAALVTESEVFGTRPRRKPKRKRQKKAAQAFLEDLRELHVDDFVVHKDHGVGRYLGIQRKALAQSALERHRGDAQAYVEVLVIEYSGGDKLFVPVTRLNLIQKFASKEGGKPKVDRLGGSTFARKKKTVAKAVQQMAEELLKLYAERGAATRQALAPPGRTYAEFEATFPFDETADQANAIEDVLSDLEGPRPMDRLVCGDVGFGKTEVAIRAAFRVAMNGRQVAILCPTTVLAQQHYQNIRERFADYPLEVRTLSRFVDKKTQTQTIKGLKAGTVDVVVGTHRLLSKDVHFHQLGLIVVDEEQRFGVAHKERIKQLKRQVDVLTLSATPIPRTLQMAIGGLRDLSLITTAPTDRRAVRTYATRWDDHTLTEAIRRELSRGGQVFFVYNRIEGLYERAQRLTELLPDARIAVAHGQMKESALEETMTDFVAGEYDILCSTAIIESGLDIPRANTMIVDRADLFGLAQLYQLRGRVGRSRERAYCYLVTPPPRTLSDDARERIEALERFTDLGSGFQVASLDMELRGAGDLLGAEQSGNASLVGFDMFVQMLEEAVAQLQGEPIIHDVDPEVSVDVEHYLPDDYIDDVGLRLSLYKRFAAADDEWEVEALATEMQDRFGPPPPPALSFVRAMTLRPGLRELKALGCDATKKRVTLHLREDTPLDPHALMAEVAKPKSPYKITPEMRLIRRFEEEGEGDTIDRVETTLRDLQRFRQDD